MESSDRLKGSHRLAAFTTESSAGRITRAAGFAKDFNGLWRFPIEAGAADRDATSPAELYTRSIRVAAPGTRNIGRRRFNVPSTERFNCLSG
jgi:hypothetical protein